MVWSDCCYYFFCLSGLGSPLVIQGPELPWLKTLPWVVEKLGSRVSQRIISCIQQRLTEHLLHAQSCPRQHRHMKVSLPVRTVGGGVERQQTTHTLIGNNTSSQIPWSKDLCSMKENKREAPHGLRGARERMAFKLRLRGRRKEEPCRWREQLCKGPAAGTESQAVWGEASGGRK